jgi:protein SCO1/2
MVFCAGFSHRLAGHVVKPSRFFWVGLALVAGTAVLWGMRFRLRSSLREVRNPTPQASRALPVYFQVSDFTLTNQNNQPVSVADLKGKVWVADIVFTRCTGPCPKITRAMKQLQDALPANSQAKLVTLTSDPEYDTPAVLRAWADRFGADSNRWMFLTGTKKQIVSAAVDSLKFIVQDKEAKDREDQNDLFIHSTVFILIDRQGRFRGSYETYGEGVDFNKTKADLVEAIGTLERET